MSAKIPGFARSSGVQRTKGCPASTSGGDHGALASILISSCRLMLDLSSIFAGDEPEPSLRPLFNLFLWLQTLATDFPYFLIKGK